MSRMAKKYSSSRYSQTSPRRSSSQPRGGSMRTTAGALACTCIGLADSEGAVTVAIKLCATTFARGPAKFQIRVPEFLAPNAEALSFASVHALPRGGPGSGLGLFFHFVDVAVLDLAHQIAAMKKIVFQMRGQLARHHAELVVDHLAPG